jgi:hypothetical protein
MPAGGELGATRRDRRTEQRFFLGEKAQRGVVTAHRDGADLWRQQALDHRAWLCTVKS